MGVLTGNPTPLCHSFSCIGKTDSVASFACGGVPERNVERSERFPREYPWQALVKSSRQSPMGNQKAEVTFGFL
ncbi:MAG TPA: hypothetical protein VEA58_12600 [Anaerovoracaceae bacterium]|nr:hypothetical protein [Anaerovoracaceae bacterium]